MVPKKPTQKTVLVTSSTTARLSISLAITERIRSGGLAGILLSVVHLLEKLLCFLLIRKGQSGQAILRLEGVEKRAVLIIRPGVVDFLVPYYSSSSGLFDS